MANLFLKIVNIKYFLKHLLILEKKNFLDYFLRLITNTCVSLQKLIVIYTLTGAPKDFHLINKCQVPVNKIILYLKLSAVLCTTQLVYLNDKEFCT